MARFYVFFILFLLAISFAPFAHADENGPTVSEREKKRKAMIKSYDSTPGEIYFGMDNSSFANPYYKKEVNKALAKRSGRFDFTTMRNYYKQTSQYDPFADKVKDRIIELSYIVAQNENQAAVEKALNDFSEIIKAHMANINVVTLATSLSREDTRYGDPKFYQWISQGLMSVVRKHGNGASFDNAYLIICTDEEDLLLRSLKVAALKTELIPYGSRYYNLHEVKDLRSGETREIFVDVTMPLAKAESIREKEGKKIKIRR